MSWFKSGSMVLMVVAMVQAPVLSLAADAAPESETLAFELLSTTGEVVAVERDGAPAVTVVCFLGAECPLAKLYGPRLEAMAAEFADARFIGVNSNRQDSMDDVRRYVTEHKLTFPVVKDYDNKVADQYGAERTPEVFVLDRMLNVRYRGRIDDQYTPGVAKAETSRAYLREAIQAVLNGTDVATPKTKPVGCHIGRVEPGEVSTEITFAHEISRVLQRNCVECHRPGEIGPFSLIDYDEVVGWGETMLEVVDNGRMPPWHASSEQGHFANARIMPDKDKQLLQEWVRGGMPFGDAKDLPPAPEFTSGWQLPREPDVELLMRERPYEVPAEGIVEYQYFVVDPGFEEDTWITAAEVIPGNRAVVHHCIVFIRPPDGKDFRVAGGLAGYVPGQRPLLLPEGYGRRVPAGSHLVFQMHYTPNGTPQTDITKVGLLLAPEETITHEVTSMAILNQDFEIPPHAENFEVTAGRGKLPANGELLAVTPHMHVRGKQFRVYADGKAGRTTLLDVPAYDFNWQHIYEFAEPVSLKGIERLEFVATFDNSKNNPFNPDPTAYVTWGDQTWEEMAIVFFEVARPRKAEPAVKPARQQPNQQQAKVAAFVDDYLQRFDEDGDGVITREEMPLSVQRFAFRRFDKDNDDLLTREEIAAVARREL